MENQPLINKIKSLYLAKDIFNYIKDKNFPIKLFLYSHYFQRKFNIKHIYLEKYLHKINFKLEDCMHQLETGFAQTKGATEYYYNTVLSAKKLNKKHFENILLNILENKQLENIDDEDMYYQLFQGHENANKNEIYIDVNSPILKLVGKTKYLETSYTILIIPIHFYYSFDSESTKKKLFEVNQVLGEIRNSKIKITSLFYIFKEKPASLEYFKYFNINFNHTKRLGFQFSHNNFNHNKFFNFLFSIPCFQRNLVTLKILLSEEFDKVKYIKIESILFETINNFKSLKYLVLSGFNMDKNFIINLTNLKFLKIRYCKNLFISEACGKNIQKLDLSFNDINDSLNIFKNTKNIKELYLYNNKIYKQNIFENIKFDNLEVLNLRSTDLDLKILEDIEFKELKVLEMFLNDITDIKSLEKFKMEKLEVLDLKGNKISDINVLKYVNFKNLKELYLSNNKISNIDVFEYVDFKNLRKVDLCNNAISNVDVLEKLKFDNIEYFDLWANHISNKDLKKKIYYLKL